MEEEGDNLEEEEEEEEEEVLEEEEDDDEEEDDEEEEEDDDNDWEGDEEETEEEEEEDDPTMEEEEENVEEEEAEEEEEEEDEEEEGEEEEEEDDEEEEGEEEEEEEEEEALTMEKEESPTMEEEGPTMEKDEEVEDGEEGVEEKDEVEQAAVQEAQLRRALGEIKAEKEKMIRRRARMQRRGAGIEELETMDLTNMDDDVRIVRRALLGVIEMQEHQTTILQDIQQSLAVLAGRAPVQTGTSLQVHVQTVFTQTPSQVAVTTQPAVSQPVQPQGTQPQQLAQQPVSPGPQPGVVQGPRQPQWVPKTAIAAPKPFTGDKRGEDLDTWLRSVPVYVRCKLTLPHEEVFVAASYLEGSAARGLSGFVHLQGYGHEFRTWAASQKLEDFLKMVEERWHDPQEAQRATDVILTLHTRQFKLVREATDAVERLICVPGVRYDPQVLLTSYLRCFSQPLRNQLAREANINMHNFPSFSKMALDLEAKIGHGQAPTTDGRKKTLPPNWKANGRLMFVDNDGSTIEVDEHFQEGVGSEAGSVETSEGGVVAAVAQKGKATGKRRGGSPSRSQVDPNAPPWEKAGLTEDVWRDRYSRQACIRCGQYGHSQYKCRNKKCSGKHVGPVGIVVVPTRVEVVETPSPSREMAQATDSSVVPQTLSDPSSLCSMNVFESLEELEVEWSRSYQLASWTALVKAPKGEMFVGKVVIGGRNAGAYYDTCSTRNFINRACVERLHLQGRVQRLSRRVESTCANKQRMVVNDYLQDVECCFPYAGGDLRHRVSFLVSGELPMDMLLGMYYLSVAQPQFDWDRKVVKHNLSGGGTARLHKFKASSLIESYGCMCTTAFYNYYKQNQEEGMYLVYVSAAGEPVKMRPEIEGVVAKYPDLFEEPTRVVEREVVHAMEIIPGSSIPKGRIYRMSPGELDKLRRQLKELVEKGWIRPSVSPYGSPVLFVPKKKEGTLRMCIVYRGLNAITVRNREPLPRIDDLLDRVQGCRYFSKIDLKSGYNQIAIQPEDQHNNAFQTRYGLYEFVVIPFGLCNAPGTFQHTMNRIFHDYLDKFVIVYLDDILIFSKTVEEHVAHLDKVLSLLRQHKFKINVDAAMVWSNGLYDYRPRCIQSLCRWERMLGDGPTVTAILDYSYSRREAKLKINVEGGREEEMRADPGLQMAITEARDRAERRCLRDGVTYEIKVIVTYLDEGTSTDMVEWEQRHLDRDNEAETDWKLQIDAAPEAEKAQYRFFYEKALKREEEEKEKEREEKVKAHEALLCPDPAAAATAAAAASGSAGNSEIVAVPSSDQTMAGLSGSFAYIDRKAAQIPSKYDEKDDIESWISSMRSYFDVLGTPPSTQSSILGTNVEPIVRGFLETQAAQSGYKRIDLNKWLKATPTATLEELLIKQYVDPHAAAKARLKLDKLKHSKWTGTMHSLQQYVSKLFATVDLEMTAQSCLDVIKGTVPSTLKDRLGLRLSAYTDWLTLMRDLVKLEAQNLPGGSSGKKTTSRKRFPGSNRLAAHDLLEADEKTLVDESSFDDDQEQDCGASCSLSAHESEYVNDDESMNAFKKTAFKSESVSIDLTDMGKKSRNDYSQVMVIVDRFSKFLNLIPLPPHAPTDLVIEEFNKRYILQCSPPKTLVSDRDTRFMSADWKDFTSQTYDMKLKLMSGRHPEANGLAEEINQTVIQLLRTLIVPDQNSWDEELSIINTLAKDWETKNGMNRGNNLSAENIIQGVMANYMPANHVVDERGKKKAESEEEEDDDDEDYDKKGDLSRSRKNGGNGDRGTRERRKYDDHPKKSFVCYYCGEIGHTTTYCRPLEEDVKSGVAKKDVMGHVCDNSWNKLDPRHPGGMILLALKHDEKMKKKKNKRKVNVNIHFLIDELPNELVQETSDPHTTIELSLQSLTLTEDASDEAFASASSLEGNFTSQNPSESVEFSSNETTRFLVNMMSFDGDLPPELLMEPSVVLGEVRNLQARLTPQMIEEKKIRKVEESLINILDDLEPELPHRKNEQGRKRKFIIKNDLEDETVITDMITKMLEETEVTLSFKEPMTLAPKQREELKKLIEKKKL
ncbi:hypothetical protein CBR_g31366 [Chara braunii]|uniref:Reverse transcriptase n=1 Tax=Chara braunii TaxID=69332 RepID=A0A388LER9_CHABU|nr:hypothetical protein CBR_g31366 [Chara braunii]|eukprot:GBG80810.1 hypothetical protein CBR_g31366 [Chara braunii]